MARELAILFDIQGKPAKVVNDSGTEFTLNAILTFTDDRKFAGITHGARQADSECLYRKLQPSAQGRVAE